MDHGNWLNKTVNIMKKYYKDTEKTPVLKYVSPEKIKKEVNIPIGKKGIGMDDLFLLLEKIVLKSPKTSSKGFFNLLFGGKFMPAVVAEMLTAVLNNTMHTYKSAGVHILIEQEVIAFLLKKIGLPKGDGIFVPGASISNMVAMILARNEKEKTAKAKGLTGKRLIAYTSDQGHYSILKAANFIGIGRDNVREVKSDAQGKMDVQALEKQIKEDKKKGYVPFFVNATAGTTILGVFDPLPEIAKIAKKYNIWFHIDGALGGSVSLSKKHKHLLKGSALADSMARNPHKMMNVPILASAILVKNPTLLHKHFNESADYLFQMDTDAYNPATKSIQCGRRNDALKVWAALKYAGEDGYEARINRQFENAKYAVQCIKKDKRLQLISEPESINICFQVKGKSAIKVCEDLYKKGLIKVGYGTRKGKDFIRMVCVDADMTKKDIDNFFKYIVSL